MKNYAFTDPTHGEILGIVLPAEDGQYTHGQEIDGMIVREIAGDDLPVVKQATSYWNVISNTWESREDRMHEAWYVWSWPGYWRLDEELLYKEIRRIRDSLLKETDWTQLGDAPLTQAQKDAWAAYRQSLRDLPQNQPNLTDIAQVVWPDKPLYSVIVQKTAQLPRIQHVELTVHS